MAPTAAPSSIDKHAPRIRLDPSLRPDIHAILAATPRIRAPNANGQTAAADASIAGLFTVRSHISRMHILLQGRIATADRDMASWTRSRQQKADGAPCAFSEDNARQAAMELTMRELAFQMRSLHRDLNDIRNRINELEAAHVAPVHNTSDSVSQTAQNETSTAVFERDAVVFGALDNTSSRVADLEAALIEVNKVVNDGRKNSTAMMGNVEQGGAAGNQLGGQVDNLENYALNQTRTIQQLEGDLEKMQGLVDSITAKMAEYNL